MSWSWKGFWSFTRSMLFYIWIASTFAYMGYKHGHREGLLQGATVGYEIGHEDLLDEQTAHLMQWKSGRNKPKAA